jgi:hypothetical protein
MIGIAYFNPGAKQDYLFTAKVAGFKGTHSGEIIPFSQTRGLTPPSENHLIDIHPEYYLILPNNFDERIRDRFDEWVYTLKTSVVKEEFKAAGLQEAGEKLNILKMTPEERRAYEKYRRRQTDDNTVIETSKAEGLAEGLAKGRAEGRAEGKAEGILEAAKAWKRNGGDMDVIAKNLGLTVDEVLRL